MSGQSYGGSYRSFKIDLKLWINCLITIKYKTSSAMRHLTNRFQLFSSFKPQPYRGPSFNEVWANHQKYMFPFYKPYYKTPFFAVQGRGQYLYDEKGREFLDLVAGVSTVSVGHCHPRLTKIFAEQASKLIHISPIYFHQYHGEYCKALCQELGEGFDVVFLCNSGSEANDFATNLVRIYTQSEKIYALRNGYHGISGNTISLTNIRSWNSQNAKPIEVEKFATPNTYRSPHTLESFAYDAEQLLSSTSNGKIAGTWIQPVLGAGGIYPLPQGYFKKMEEATKRYGGLLVSDEVQTGFGRVGKSYWGFKAHGVKPDVVITAKAIANGYPMAAVATSKKIMQSFKTAYFNTYGGGALQCRLGLEVLKIIKQEKLPENAETIGNYLKKQFKRIGDKCPKVGDVRGHGMMIAIEFVKSKQCKTPDADTVADVLQQIKDEGILFGKAGTHILRIVGTLCLNMNDAKKVVQVVEHVLGKLK